MLVYANSFQNRFAWDDDLFIVQNREIKTAQPWPKYFLEGSEGLYRPLRTMLYSVTYRFSGLNPVGYHIVGKTLNALVVCVLYALLVLLFTDSRAAFWGALLFALHPLHTERVTFITASYDIMGDLFWLSSVVCYVAGRRGRGEWYFVLSMVLFTLGLFSSETAAVAPLVIILYDLTIGSEKGEGWKFAALRSKIVWVPFLVLLLAYLSIRSSVLGTVARSGTSAFNTDPIGNYVTMSGVVVQYFKLLLIPWPLVVVRDVTQAVAPFSNLLLLSALFVSVLIVTALLYCKKNPMPAFSFLWFFVVLSPNLNFIPTGTLMAERYVYIPSAMLSFFVALVFRETSETQKQKAVFWCLAVATVFFVMTAARNHVWRNETALWADAVNTSPRGSSVVANLSVALKDIGQNDQAEKLLLYALRVNAADPLLLEKLGGVYMNVGRLDEAEKAYLQIPQNPKNWYGAQLNIAVIRMRQGKSAEAVKPLEEILEKYPDEAKALNDYAYVLISLERKGWSSALVRAFANSGDVEYIKNLAVSYQVTGNAVAAKKVAQIGLYLDPQNEKLLTVLK